MQMQIIINAISLLKSSHVVLFVHNNKTILRVDYTYTSLKNVQI